MRKPYNDTGIGNVYKWRWYWLALARCSWWKDDWVFGSEVDPHVRFRRCPYCANGSLYLWLGTVLPDVVRQDRLNSGWHRVVYYVAERAGIWISKEQVLKATDLVVPLHNLTAQSMNGNIFYRGCWSRIIPRSGSIRGNPIYLSDRHCDTVFVCDADTPSAQRV